MMEGVQSPSVKRPLCGQIELQSLESVIVALACEWLHG